MSRRRARIYDGPHLGFGLEFALGVFLVVAIPYLHLIAVELVRVPGMKVVPWTAKGQNNGG